MKRLAAFSIMCIGMAPQACASDAPRFVVATDDVAQGAPIFDGVAQAEPMVDGSRPELLSPNVDYPDTGPPQGTLGRTYELPSRPVPLDEHPRTGMLVVRTRSPMVHMHVDRMGGFRRNDGYWQFKSDRPLVPGVPSIVAVEARMTGDNADPVGVRFVRLIPGRVVYLDF